MSTLPPIGSLVADKYRIEGLLGEGGMGAVFSARHELMDKVVALKWLKPQLAENPEARDRFMREARAAARIDHPNVVEVYDVGVHQGALFMVMERLHGQSFEDLLEQENGLTIPQALRLLIGAMQGVQAAHDKGIIHRDIKPDNLFIVHDPHRAIDVAKVLDFGISKLNEEAHGVDSFTRTGSVMGTPLYMSLEQINGSRDVDARTDVYSFGVLLYRALTGQLPFDGETLGMLAIQVATTDPPRPKQLRPELPTALDNVVMKAIARNRDDRFSSMQEMVDALSMLGSTEGFLGQMTHRMATPPQLTPKTPMIAPMSSRTAEMDTINSAEITAAETAFGVDVGDSIRPAGLPNNRPQRIVIAAVILLVASGGAWALWGRGNSGPRAAAPVDSYPVPPTSAAEETKSANKPVATTQSDSPAATHPAPPQATQPQTAAQVANVPKASSPKTQQNPEPADATKNRPLRPAQARTISKKTSAAPTPAASAPAQAAAQKRVTARPRSAPANTAVRSGKKLTTDDF